MRGGEWKKDVEAEKGREGMGRKGGGREWDGP